MTAEKHFDMPARIKSFITVNETGDHLIVYNSKFIEKQYFDHEMQHINEDDLYKTVDEIDELR